MISPRTFISFSPASRNSNSAHPTSSMKIVLEWYCVALLALAIVIKCSAEQKKKNKHRKICHFPSDYFAVVVNQREENWIKETAKHSAVLAVSVRVKVSAGIVSVRRRNRELSKNVTCKLREDFFHRHIFPSEMMLGWFFRLLFILCRVSERWRNKKDFLQFFSIFFYSTRMVLIEGYANLKMIQNAMCAFHIFPTCFMHDTIAACLVLAPNSPIFTIQWFSRIQNIIVDAELKIPLQNDGRANFKVVKLLTPSEIDTYLYFSRIRYLSFSNGDDISNVISGSAIKKGNRVGS